MKPLSKLDMIRGAVAALAKARAKLAVTVSRLQARVDAAHRAAMPRIRAQVGAVADAHANLKGLLQESPELFERPRSITERGIKFGLRRHDAEIDLPRARAEQDKIVAAIKARYRERVWTQLGLIERVEQPNAAALLKHCTPEELQELGISYQPAGDEALIKPADAAIDKLVAKLLKAATDDQEEAA